MRENMLAQTFPIRHHTRRYVDRVAEEAVSRHLVTQHAAHNGTLAQAKRQQDNQFDSILRGKACRSRCEQSKLKASSLIIASSRTNH